MRFLANQAEQSIDDAVAEALKNAGDMEEFEMLLNETINDELSKHYGREGMIEPIIEKDIQKNTE